MWSDEEAELLSMEVDIQTCSFTKNFTLATDGAVTVKDVELS